MRILSLTTLAVALLAAPAGAQTDDPTCGTCATINGGLQTLQQSQAAQQQLQQAIQAQLNAQAIADAQAQPTLLRRPAAAPLQVLIVQPRLTTVPPRRVRHTSKVRNTNPAGKPGS